MSDQGGRGQRLSLRCMLWQSAGLFPRTSKLAGIGKVLPFLPFLFAPSMALCSARGAAPLPGAASAAPHQLSSSLHFDFESGDLSGWQASCGDEPFVRFGLSDALSLAGRLSLRVEAAGWDTTRPSNECVTLRLELPRPPLLGPDDEVSWLWWIRDKELNDGVGLLLRLRDPTTGRTDQIEWMSHSNRARGDWPFDDPECQTIRHRERIGTRFESNPDAIPLPARFEVIAIEIYLVSSTSQVLVLDEIWIGPHGEGPRPEEDRRSSPGSIQPRVVSLQVADLDGDGRLDQLIGTAGGPPLLRLARKDGTSMLLSGELAGLRALADLTSPVLADFNRDGSLDLCGLTGGHLCVFQGIGQARFAQRPAPPLARLVHHHPHGLLASDLLPPAGPELLVHRLAAILEDTLYVIDPSWKAAASPLPSPAQPGLRGNYRQTLAVADVDNDGDLDLFSGNCDLYLQDRETGSLLCVSDRWLPERGNYQTGAAFGDIDNDGDMDLFITVDVRQLALETFVTHQHCLLYRNDGDRFTDVTAQNLPGSSRHAHAPLLEDFDLDGDLDLFYTQDHQWEPPSPSNQPGNVYLENDGTGHFQRPRSDSWITQSPAAIEALSGDADGDGDPDLLLRDWEWQRAMIDTNLWRPAHPPIVVRVLDRRGAPHAAAARLELLDATGKLVGMRQTGVGNMPAGSGATSFACPTDAEYALRVTFPGQRGTPLLYRGLRPGARLTIFEPFGSSFLAQPLGRMLVGWRHLAQKSAGLPGLMLALVALVYGLVLGTTLYGARRLMRGALAAVRTQPAAGGKESATAGGQPVGLGTFIGSRGRWAILIAVVLTLIMGVTTLLFWPRHPQTEPKLWAVAGGLLVGAAAGMLLAWLDSTWRRRMRDADRLPDARLALLEAIDGFSHAQWVKHLGGVAMLARGLAEGSDPSLVLPRLESRLRSYEEVIRPQMQRIAQIMPRVGLASELEKKFLNQSNAIEQAVGRIRLQDPRAMQEADLRAMAEAATRMHVTVDGMFQALGKVLQSDVRAALEHALERARQDYSQVEFACSGAQASPIVFGATADLANIFENLLANGARAALATRDLRAPRVEVECVREGGLLLLLFRDTGPGIPPGTLEAAMARTTLTPGRHGRGLPYALRRLHQFDGKLQVLSSLEDQGTVMAVSLRILASVPAQAAAPGKPHAEESHEELQHPHRG